MYLQPRYDLAQEETGCLVKVSLYRMIRGDRLSTEKIEGNARNSHNIWGVVAWHSADTDMAWGTVIADEKTAN
jgi:hypothetical protein